MDSGCHLNGFDVLALISWPKPLLTEFDFCYRFENCDLAFYVARLLTWWHSSYIEELWTIHKTETGLEAIVSTWWSHLRPPLPLNYLLPTVAERSSRAEVVNPSISEGTSEVPPITRSSFSLLPQPPRKVGLVLRLENTAHPWNTPPRSARYTKFFISFKMQKPPLPELYYSQWLKLNIF